MQNLPSEGLMRTKNVKHKKNERKDRCNTTDSIMQTYLMLFLQCSWSYCIIELLQLRTKGLIRY